MPNPYKQFISYSDSDGRIFQSTDARWQAWENARQETLSWVSELFDTQSREWLEQSEIDVGIRQGEHKYVPSVQDIITLIRQEAKK